MLKITVIMFSLMFSTLAFASGHLGSKTKIDTIRAFSTYAIVHTKNTINSASCAEANKTFILQYPQDSNGGAVFATLLAAKASNAVFNPWCPDQCQSHNNKSYTLCYEGYIK